tara:strand:+ start:6614 stop:6973 length:360 start_codon:yes stop_codon:yes gene_type:complete
MSLRKNDIFMIFVAFVLGFMAQKLIKTICGNVVEGGSEVADQGVACIHTPKICYAHHARGYTKQNHECSDDKECHIDDQSQKMYFPEGPPKCIHHPTKTQYCNDPDRTPCPKNGVCPPV